MCGNLLLAHGDLAGLGKEELGVTVCDVLDKVGVAWVLDRGGYE